MVIVDYGYNSLLWSVKREARTTNGDIMLSEARVQFDIEPKEHDGNGMFGGVHEWVRHTVIL